MCERVFRHQTAGCNALHFVGSFSTQHVTRVCPQYEPVPAAGRRLLPVCLVLHNNKCQSVINHVGRAPHVKRVWGKRGGERQLVRSTVNKQPSPSAL